MKKFFFTASSILLLLCSVQLCSAQYGQDNSKLNSNTILDRNNPMAQTIYTVDTTINHMDFGTKKNKDPFIVVFPLKYVGDSKSTFTFTTSQIVRTKMSKGSGISKINFTDKGFEVTYNPKRRTGVVDDYLVIFTENGEIVLWLTGELIKEKKEINS